MLTHVDYYPRERLQEYIRGKSMDTNLCLRYLHGFLEVCLFLPTFTFLRYISSNTTRISIYVEKFFF